jgi:hypothetical protein
MAVQAETRGSIEALDALHGRHLRITLIAAQEPGRIEGRLRRRSAERIELSRGGHLVSVPVSAVARIELMPRGRIRGLLIGALAWGALAFAFHEEDPDAGRAARVGQGMLAGAAVGALFDRARQAAPEVIYER